MKNSTNVTHDGMSEVVQEYKFCLSYWAGLSAVSGDILQFFLPHEKLCYRYVTLKYEVA
jgi:hypothetical protein